MDPHRRPRRHGRRAAARRHDGRRVLPRGRMPARRASRCACAPRYLDRPGERPRRGAGDASSGRSREGKPVSVGLLGNAADMLPRAASAGACAPTAVTDQTSAHDPAQRLPARRAGPLDRSGRARRETDPRSAWSAPRPSASMAGHVRAMLDFHRMGMPGGRLTATTSGRWRWTRASPTPSNSPASSRPISARCSAAASVRSAWVGALPATPEDIFRTDAKVKELLPDDREPPHTGSTWPARGSASRACRRGSAGWAWATATASASPSTRWWPRGELKRAGGDRARPPRFRQRSPRPNRETEAMRRRLRRRLGLAAAQRAAQLRLAARPGFRCTTAAASAWASRSTLAWSSSADGTPEAASRESGGCCGTTPPPASCAMPTRGYPAAADSARANHLDLPSL